MLFATALTFACLLASSVEAAPVPAKLRAALKSSSSRVRIAAIVAVSRSKADDARSVLETMLSDDEETVVAAAVEGLGVVGDVAAIAVVAQQTRSKSALVRKVAKKTLELLNAKQKALLAKGGLVVDVGDVRNATGKALNGAEARLRAKITAALMKDGRKALDIRNGGVTKGYGLLLKLNNLVPFAQDGVSGIQIDCDMTVVELPGKSLRMNSSASTGAGVRGTLTPEREASLVLDAVDACAPELARDFVDYLLKREGPG